MGDRRGPDTERHGSRDTTSSSRPELPETSTHRRQRTPIRARCCACVCRVAARLPFPREKGEGVEGDRAARGLRRRVAGRGPCAKLRGLAGAASQFYFCFRSRRAHSCVFLRKSPCHRVLPVRGLRRNSALPRFDWLDFDAARPNTSPETALSLCLAEIARLVSREPAASGVPARPAEPLGSGGLWWCADRKRVCDLPLQPWCIWPRVTLQAQTSLTRMTACRRAPV